jgi:hypothetical protein
MLRREVDRRELGQEPLPVGRTTVDKVCVLNVGGTGECSQGISRNPVSYKPPISATVAGALSIPTCFLFIDGRIARGRSPFCRWNERT